MGRLSVSQNTDPIAKESKPMASMACKLSAPLFYLPRSFFLHMFIRVSAALFHLFIYFYMVGYTFQHEATGSVPSTPPRASVSTGPKTTAAGSAAGPNTATLKRTVPKVHSTTNIQIFNKSDVVPVIVPRTSTRVEQASDSRKETTTAGRTVPYNAQSKITEFRKQTNNRDDLERANVPVQSGSIGSKSFNSNEVTAQNFIPGATDTTQPVIAAERNMVEARSIGTGNLGANLSMEPSTRENCMFHFLKYYNSTLLDMCCF